MSEMEEHLSRVKTETELFLALYVENQNVQAQIERNESALRILRAKNSDIETQVMMSYATIIAQQSTCNIGREWSLRAGTPTWFDDVLPKLPEKMWKEHFRLSKSTIDFIVTQVKGVMAREDSHLRPAVPIEKRVCIALFKMSSCAEYRVVAGLFGVGVSTVCEILHEFTATLVEKLEPQFVSLPSNNEELKSTCDFFEATLGFPMAFGAINGFHIPISPPKEHAWEYYNAKGWYSVVLFAVVDYRYHFSFISVGSPGSYNNEYIYDGSSLQKKFENGDFDSHFQSLGGVKLCGLLLADSAFSLTQNIVKPFLYNSSMSPEERLFNYNICKAHGVVDNAFGRVNARFRMIANRMDTNIRYVNNIIRAACILHNICESLGDMTEASWEQDVSSVLLRNPYPQPATTNDKCDEDGVKIRNALVSFFASRDKET